MQGQSRNLDKALEPFTDADRTAIYAILAQDLNNVARAFDHGLRLYLSLTGSVARTNSPTDFRVGELHAYLDSFPDHYTAADKRLSALADYVGRLPESEQQSSFDQLTTHLLSGQLADAAADTELLADVLALHLCSGLDPKRYLETARVALASYRPSAASSSQEVA